MNTTVLTVPRASALAALVPFAPQKAYTQLQLWSAAPARLWSASLYRHTDCQAFVDYAEWALDAAREKHKTERQKGRDAEEQRVLCGGFTVERRDPDEFHAEHGEEARFIWSADDGGSDGEESERIPDYAMDQRYNGGDYAGDGALGLFSGDGDDFSYAESDTRGRDEHLVGIHATAAADGGGDATADDTPGYKAGYPNSLAEPEGNGNTTRPGADESSEAGAKNDETEDGYFSEPEWCDADILDAEEALRTARRNKNTAHETSRLNATEKFRARDALTVFFTQHPEFQHVAAADDLDDTRSRKRKRHHDGAPTGGLPSMDDDRASKLATWHQTVRSAFRDRATMPAFPEPLVWPCFNTACRKRCKSSERALRACECNIRVAFENSSARQLKLERHEWHPDRFGVCPADKREVWQKMATEVFTAISAMLRES
ncbi:hypothetical protein LTR36_007516 [Oleoguttula mirabilis]|uniref:Uncharacterized protein n=1 Tax=Oleoguttula mirabilis TaxID=1507867 RepID=A0AAV9JUU2_9PEZI|nr:hypothetical protein LTR36_007516 [Oleoguttula mirabilis]